MNNYLDISINNFDQLEKIVEAISNKKSNCNINENLFDSICCLSKDETFENLFENFDKYVEELNKKIEKSNRIINPEAVSRMLLLRKSIIEIKNILCDDIVLTESIHNDLGWKYTLVLKCSYLGMTGNAMTLMKIAMLISNSFEVFPDKNDDKYQVWFTVNDIYNLFH